MRALFLAGLVLLVGLPADAAPRPRVEKVFAFTDPEIDESSGLVDQGPNVLTVNDSGDSARVFVVAKATGDTVGVTTYSSGPVTDVEAIAKGPKGIYVGDIGDNRGERDHVSVYVMPTVGRGDRTVAAERYDFRYVGGARDAEALLVQPGTGRVFIATKGLFGGRMYAAPRKLSRDKVNVLRPVARVGGLVTDGEFLPGGDYAILRNYGSAAVYRTSGWQAVDGFPLPDQEQGEALAWTEVAKRLLISSEGEHSRVLSMRVPPRVHALVFPPVASPVVPGVDDDPPAQAVWWPYWAAGGFVALLVLWGAALLRGARRRSRWTP